MRRPERVRRHWAGQETDHRPDRRGERLAWAGRMYDSVSANGAKDQPCPLYLYAIALVALDRNLHACHLFGRAGRGHIAGAGGVAMGSERGRCCAAFLGSAGNPGLPAPTNWLWLTATCRRRVASVRCYCNGLTPPGPRAAH